MSSARATIGSATVGIVGGGPAGSSLAMRLRRLGHSVLIVTDSRCRYTLQGLSERAIAALRELGAPRTLATLGALAPRLVLWNGLEAEPNDECLIDRRAFDEALLTDAGDLGASVVQGSVARKPLPAAGPLEVDTGDGPRSVSADAWIEARGRSALRYRRPITAGAATLTLQQVIHSAPGQPWSAVFAVPDGWCWVGARANGDGVIQRSLRAGGRSRCIPVGATSDLLRPRPLDHPSLEHKLKDARAAGRVRGFSTERALDVGDPHHLRVGDALNAPDPLSGHGVCEAIASSRNVAAAMNTLLRRPASAGLAHQFVADRARERYRILGTLGRHSYEQERRWMTREFWLERRAEPKSDPARALPEIRQAPVLDHDEIVLREVLILPRHPRGVWRVHDVPVVELMTQVRAGNAPEKAAAALQVSPLKAARAMQWLQDQGIPIDLHA